MEGYVDVVYVENMGIKKYLLDFVSKTNMEIIIIRRNIEVFWVWIQIFIRKFIVFILFGMTINRKENQYSSVALPRTQSAIIR